MQEQTTDITITQIDTCTLNVQADEGILRELHEFYTFEVPGYQFMPSFQSGLWDGSIRVFNLWKRELPAGLLAKTLAWCKKNKYTATIEKDLLPTSIPVEEFDELYDDLNLPSDFTKEEHQTKLIHKGLELKRALLLGPTGSGKSLIIYALSQITNREHGKKILIVVPTINLVSQFPEEFKNYGYDKSVCKFSETKDIRSNADIFVSTWHSVYKLPKKFFDQFGTIVFDEVHLATAKSVTTLMSKTSLVPYKFGLTATLQDAKCHALTLEGMFGPKVSSTTTKKLMDAGKLTPVKIIAVLLKHPDEICEQMKEASYQEEIETIISSTQRNAFLIKFISKIPDNTLVLFRRIKHGKFLYESLKKYNAGKRNIYYIDGGISGEERERIRQLMETEKDAILVASFDTMSTGTNIKNLHNAVFVHPSKAKIRVLQSIGRILRKLLGKMEAKVFDIADNMMWKKHKNTTFEHFLFRLEAYNLEQHPVIFKEIKL